MFTPSAMEIVSVLVERDREKEVAARLVRSGVFQPVDLKDAETGLDKIASYSSQAEAENLGSIETRLNVLTEKSDPGGPVADKEVLTGEQAIGKIEEMENQLLPLIEKRNSLQNEIKKAEPLYQHLSAYLPFPGYKPAEMSFLAAAAGKIEEKNLASFKKTLAGVPYLFYPFRQEDSKTVFFVVLLKKDQAVLDEGFKTANCEKIEYPAGEIKEPAGIKAAIEKNQKLLAEITPKIAAGLEKFKQDIAKIRFFLKFEKSIIEAKKFAYGTENTVLISGWVPADKKSVVFRGLKNVARSNHYVEAKKVEKTNISKERVPVSLTHSFLVRPLELIIETYGLPRYGTVDPTLFLVLTFPLMFGAMYGDMGHGIVLALAGLIFLKLRRKKGGLQAGLLLLYCGLAAMLFGRLYGSFFGVRFTPLWLGPMYGVMPLFKVSILVGIGLITFGIGINIINALKDRDWPKVFFDNAGLVSGIFFWALLLLAYKFLLQKQLSHFLLFLTIGSIFLLFLKPVFEKILFKKNESLGAGFTESMPNLMEVGMSYLTNTLSFLRIAAFAVAHVGLLMGVYIIADLIRNVASGHLRVLEIVAGNLVIILMEGLIVLIQDLRLHYYETFTRFFITGREKFKPVQV